MQYVGDCLAVVVASYFSLPNLAGSLIVRTSYEYYENWTLKILYFFCFLVSCLYDLLERVIGNNQNSLTIQLPLSCA